VWGAVQWCATRAYRDCVIANMRLVQCGAWPLECPFPLGLPCLPALPACALCVHLWLVCLAPRHMHTVSALHIQGPPWLAIPTRAESATRLFVGTSTDALFVHASPAGCLLQPSPQVGRRWTYNISSVPPTSLHCALFACFGHRRCTHNRTNGQPR
jgi:hypothetical protein